MTVGVEDAWDFQWVTTDCYAVSYGDYYEILPHKFQLPPDRVLPLSRFVLIIHAKGANRKVKTVTFQSNITQQFEDDILNHGNGNGNGPLKLIMTPNHYNRQQCGMKMAIRLLQNNTYTIESIKCLMRHKVIM